MANNKIETTETGTSRRVERPGSDLVMKGVLILDFGTDRVNSQQRRERAIMKQQGSVISGYELSRDWEKIDSLKSYLSFPC